MNKKILSLILVLVLVLSLVSNVFAREFTEDEFLKKQDSDKKVYCTATLENDFADDSIIVVINKSNSYINKEIEKNKFSGISAVNQI